MAWWIWLVIAVVLYILLSLGPWIGLQFVVWRLRRRAPFLSVESRRFNRLMAVEQEQTNHWPQLPRSGRYHDVDSRALDLLLNLRVSLSQISDLWSSLSTYRAPDLSLPAVLAFQAWRPLLEAIKIWRDKRRLNVLLQQGEDTVETILQQHSHVQGIPERAQGELSDVRAEARRLYVLWEEEVESGTQGIQALGNALVLLDDGLGDALEAIKEAHADDLPAMIQEADDQLAEASDLMHRSEQELTMIGQNRRRVHQILERVQAGKQLLEERWKGLQVRGAKDPSVMGYMDELQEMAAKLASMSEPATPEAYAQVIEQTAGYDAMEKSLSGQLDALDQIMSRSKEAIKGDLQVLLQAQQACTGEDDADDSLDLDVSTALIAQAQEIFAQAEEQRSLGTWHGYQTTLSLAERATETLNQAISQRNKATAAMEQLTRERNQADPDVRKALRERAHRVEQSFSFYQRHWDTASQTALSEALARLDDVDKAWGRLPASFVTEGTLRQSELEDVQTALGDVTEGLLSASQTVDQIETRLTHIGQLREQLEQGLELLDSELCPKLEGIRDAMLPELKERFDAWLAAYQELRPSFEDPLLIDYEQAAQEWLPPTLAEAQALLAAHQNDIEHYNKELSNAQRRIDKAWQRLQKLDPMQRPVPEEDLEQLTADYDAWQTMAEESAENPALLSELVTRRMANLERRIESTRRQIKEGRQTIATLDRQFEQQSAALQKTRMSIRSLQQDSQWRRIDWVLGEGESLWERAVAIQEESRNAETLTEAINQMHRASNSVQEAQQTYTTAEQQLRTALDRLNTEFRAATTELDRVQRHAAQMRQEGPSEMLAALDERTASAMSLISMAQHARTFEDALRHLRAAQENLARS